MPTHENYLLSSFHAFAICVLMNPGLFIIYSTCLYYYCVS